MNRNYENNSEHNVFSLSLSLLSHICENKHVREKVHWEFEAALVNNLFSIHSTFKIRCMKEGDSAQPTNWKRFRIFMNVCWFLRLIMWGRRSTFIWCRNDTVTNTYAFEPSSVQTSCSYYIRNWVHMHFEEQLDLLGSDIKMNSLWFVFFFGFSITNFTG